MNISWESILKAVHQEGAEPQIISTIQLPTPQQTFRLASIKQKQSHGLYYINIDYLDEIETIEYSVILVNEKVERSDSNIYIVVNNPQLIHYKISGMLTTPMLPGIHPTAIIHPEAEISDTAHIGPYCIIGKCILEDHVILHYNVIVNDNVVIKSNTNIEGHAVIGARGMAWIWNDSGERVMQAQFGGVIIEEDCIIGSDITIVRGSLTEYTRIGKGTIMAHGTKIGHGCQIGDYVHFANNVSLAGNVTISERVFLGSGSVVSSQVSVAEGCIVGAGSVLNKSVEEAFVTLAGVPARVIKHNNFENKPKGVPKPFKNK